MKKNLKLFLIASLGFFFSCNDAIDIEQPGRLGADAAFQSLANLETGLLGTLATLDNSGQMQFNAVFTDEIGIAPSNGGQGVNDGTYGFVLNAGSVAANSFWFRYYASLNSTTNSMNFSASIM